MCREVALRLVACVHKGRRKKVSPKPEDQWHPSIFEVLLIFVQKARVCRDFLVRAGRRMLPQVLTLACALCCFGSTAVTANLLEAEVSPDAKSE